MKLIKKGNFNLSELKPIRFTKVNVKSKIECSRNILKHR